jgi:hypothetical protein
MEIMALSVSLERLVHALSSSIIRAQNLVEKAQIANLRSYFDKDSNTPIGFELKLPSLQQRDAHDTYHVPLAALVPHGSLVIKEAKIELDVEIGGVKQDAPDDGLPFPDLPEIAQGAEPIRPKLMIDPEGGGVAKSQDGNCAHITLTLTSTENTEGLARLLNEVIKAQGRVPAGAAPAGPQPAGQAPADPPSGGTAAEEAPAANETPEGKTPAEEPPQDGKPAGAPPAEAGAAD